MALLFTTLAVALLTALCAHGQGIRYDPSRLDFGLVAPCNHALDSFDLINESNDVVSPPSSFPSGGFHIEFTGASENILPGTRRKAYVRFVGDASVPIRDHPLAIQFQRPDGTFIPTSSIRLIASRAPGPCVHFAPPTLTVPAGTRVDLGIIQEGNFLNYIDSIAVITFELSWDPTLLVPDVFPVQPIAVGLHRATFSAPLLREGGRLFSIPFVTTLGNRIEASIRLEWFSLSDPRVTAMGRNGSVAIEGVCISPRSRLFDGTSTTLRTFTAYDVLGRALATAEALSLSEAISILQRRGFVGAVLVVDPITGACSTVLP